MGTVYNVSNFLILGKNASSYYLSTYVRTGNNILGEKEEIKSFFLTQRECLQLDVQFKLLNFTD